MLDWFVFPLLICGAAIFNVRVTSSGEPSASWDSGSRILNGEDAEIEDFPYYGLIVSKHNVYLSKNGQTMVNVHCGSALISPKHFLTAFHCFMNNANPKSWLVIMGLNDRCEKPSSLHTYEIVKITRHPNTVLLAKTKKNDIAIVEINRVVTDVTPIGLPVSQPVPGDSGNVIGYGLTKIETQSGNTSDLPCKLQKATQMVPDQKDCKTPKQTIEGVFCLVDANHKDAAACRGDSGGPWVIERDGALILAGVSSFGDTLCRVSVYSDFYTNVYLFRSWILDVINGKPSTPAQQKTKHQKRRSRKF